MKENREIPDAAQDRNIWLSVGTLIDGESKKPIKNAHIVYGNHEILFVGSNGNTPPRHFLQPGQSQPDVHLPNHTLLPGLIEAHAHLFLEGAELDFEKRKEYLTQDGDGLLRHALKRLDKLVKIGVMAVRDAGDKDGVGLALSRLYQSADRPLMPYLDSPGAAIHRQGRYGSFMGGALEDFSSARECIKNRVEAGADRIKLIPTGIINFKKGAVTAPPQMSKEEVYELVKAAKEFRKQTFAHASGDDGIEHAIEGGVDSVEHGFFVREDQLARMRDRRIAWVPTFAPVQEQVDHADVMGWGQEVVMNLEKILDQHAKSLVKAQEMGVIIIAGSDAGSVGVAHGYGFLYELELMEKAGLSAIDVINAATGNSSGRLGYREKFGVIKKGYKSRFIIMENSPLEKIANLRKNKIAVYDGVAYEGREDIDVSGL